MFERTYYAAHPDMMECASNEELRDRYLIQGLFREAECVLNYTHADRFVIGWAAKGINVNAVAPGYVATNNTAALQADETRNRQILERIPAAPWGEPSDLGGAAVFLASDASNYVNGRILAVDGGWLAR
jgi:NAD(P)-dependent dehydrogenase (short-subunit alcohol dehydrogenase family)